MQSTIDNTRQIYANGANHTTGQNASGSDLPYPKTIQRWRANAAVDKGEALMFVAGTTTVAISVTPMTAAVGASDPQLFAGIALTDAAAGDDVDVCVSGMCHVLAEDADAGGAFGYALTVPDTTTGRAALADTGSLLGVIGVQLGVEVGTTNVVLARIGFVARADDDGS